MQSHTIFRLFDFNEIISSATVFGRKRIQRLSIARKLPLISPKHRKPSGPQILYFFPFLSEKKGLAKRLSKIWFKKPEYLVPMFR